MRERQHEGETIHDGYMTRPEGCPRGRGDCFPLSRVASMDGDDYRTFICCGENDGSHGGPPQDKWRLCIKSEKAWQGVDILVNFDGRDMIDTASVLLNGLSWLSIGTVDEDGVPLDGRASVERTEQAP